MREKSGARFKVKNVTIPIAVTRAFELSHVCFGFATIYRNYEKNCPEKKTSRNSVSNEKNLLLLETMKNEIGDFYSAHLTFFLCTFSICFFIV